MNNKSDGKSHFWPSYVDLMTSLFVVMLVLFILSFIKFSVVNKELEANAKQMQKIKEIEKALNELDPKYYKLDPVNNRYKLMVDVTFAPNSADTTKIIPEQLNHLRVAGTILFAKMKELQEDPDINYLVVVEGLAARALYKNTPNWMAYRHRGDSLSYERAWMLKDFWDKNGYDFSKLKNCELLVVGSGYYSKSRDVTNESNNKRFTIQITPKFNMEKDSL